MASVKGVNYTNITADPIVNVDSEQLGGKLRVSLAVLNFAIVNPAVPLSVIF